MKFTFGFENHWKCLKDWIEFKLFDLIFDWKDKDYKFLEIIILNFEFLFWWDKTKPEEIK